VLTIFLLIVGCLMDIFSAIIVVLPLIIPIAAQYGVHPVHLGIIFLANLEIGYLTPPVGMNLFISSLAFNKPVVQLYRMAVPFLLIMLAVLLVITFNEGLSLWLLEVVRPAVPAK
jgi:C4-dicarboxylate transporter DctM subunit